MSCVKQIEEEVFGISWECHVLAKWTQDCRNDRPAAGETVVTAMLKGKGWLDLLDKSDYFCNSGYMKVHSFVAISMRYGGLFRICNSASLGC